MNEDNLQEHRPNRYVATPDTQPRRLVRPWFWIAALVLLAVVAVALVAVLQLRTDPEPAVAQRTTVELSYPVGDGEVRLEAAPVAVGDNRLGVRWMGGGGPQGDPPGTVDLRVEPLASDGGETIWQARAESNDSAFTVDGVPFASPGWWQVEVASLAGPEASEGQPFYLLVPDPNLTETTLVSADAGSAAAGAVYARGLASMSALERVRFDQWVSDGAGANALSEHVIDATPGAPPAFTYRAQGGLDAVVIGDRMWTRYPGQAWTTRAASPMVPPREWGEEYIGAAGFELGRVETVDGEASQIITFVVPERTDPYQSPAWYVWWVGVDSGQIRREAMISRNHYMLNEFRDFDAPVAIVPPVEAMAAVAIP